MRLQESEDGQVLELYPMGRISDRLKTLPGFLLCLGLVYWGTGGFRRFEWSFDLVELVLGIVVGAASLGYLIFARMYVRIDLRERTVVYRWGMFRLLREQVFPLDHCQVWITRDSDKKLFSLCIALMKTVLRLAEGSTSEQAQDTARMLAEVLHDDLSNFTVTDEAIEVGPLPAGDNRGEILFGDLPAKFTDVGAKVRRIDLESFKAYSQARAPAERLAGRLGVSLSDYTSPDHLVTRAPQDIDRSIRDRLLTSETEAELSDAPDAMETQHTFAGRSVVFRFPRAGFKRLDLEATVGALAILVVAAVLAALFVERTPGPDGDMWLYVAWVFVGLLGVITFVMATGALLNMVPRVTLTVSPEEVRWERRGLLFRRKKVISAVELEELVLPVVPAPTAPPKRRRFLGCRVRPSKETPGILARSDRIWFEFGRNLGADELRWIHAVITRVITV